MKQNMILILIDIFPTPSMLLRFSKNYGGEVKSIERARCRKNLIYVIELLDT